MLFGHGITIFLVDEGRCEAEGLIYRLVPLLNRHGPGDRASDKIPAPRPADN